MSRLCLTIDKYHRNLVDVWDLFTCAEEREYLLRQAVSTSWTFSLFHCSSSMKFFQRSFSLLRDAMFFSRTLRLFGLVFWAESKIVAICKSKSDHQIQSQWNEIFNQTKIFFIFIRFQTCAQTFLVGRSGVGQMIRDDGLKLKQSLIRSKQDVSRITSSKRIYTDPTGVWKLINA